MYSSCKLLFLPSLTFCLDKEQVARVPASVYNKILNIRSANKMELPKYQISKGPTYQTNSIKKVMIENLFGEADFDFLVRKCLSFPRIKLSKSETLVLDGVKTGVSLSNFAQQLRRKNGDVFQSRPLLCFTRRCWPKSDPGSEAKCLSQREGAGSLSKYERQKLQRLYTQGANAYGSVINLVKASRLPGSGVRQFLHSKPSFTKFTLATRKFKKLKAFVLFKNGV